LVSHLFMTSVENFLFCKEKQVFGMPTWSKEGRKLDATSIAGIIAETFLIRKEDYILFYLTGDRRLGGQKVHGYYKVSESPQHRGEPDIFYDDRPL